jgi:hypothetical protein
VGRLKVNKKFTSSRAARAQTMSADIGMGVKAWLIVMGLLAAEVTAVIVVSQWLISTL